MNPYPPAPYPDDYDDFAPEDRLLDDHYLEDRYPSPAGQQHGGFRRWLAFYAARAMLLVGIAMLVVGIRTDLEADRVFYPLFIARSYLFFPSYVSANVAAELSLTWRLLVVGWVLGLIAFVWFSPEKLFALVAYVSLPILIVLGSYQITGTGSLYWHGGSFLINGSRHHQVFVYDGPNQIPTELWFQCNNVGMVCIVVENPTLSPTP